MGKNSLKKTVVISAVNFVEGGPLSILKDAVRNFIEYFYDGFHLVVLVNDKKYLQEFAHQNIEMIAYSYPKKSWVLRLWFEYVHCFFISKKIQPYTWIALHDITPTVVCENKIVYCHNPAPFYKMGFNDLKMEPSLFFFRFLYSFFYRKNIKSNKYIIVQQQWLRNEFINRYHVKNVIVAYPDVKLLVDKKSVSEKEVFAFLYPALPRVFKNFEVLLDAAEALQNQGAAFEVWITIDGTENKYANALYKKYSHISSIKFLGLKPREQMANLYNNCACVVFPSKLETWGLPISEAKLYDKPILLADRSYSHETIGLYQKVSFFDPTLSTSLAALMQKVLNGTITFAQSSSKTPTQPFSQNWKELFLLLFAN